MDKVVQLGQLLVSVWHLTVAFAGVHICRKLVLWILFGAMVLWWSESCNLSFFLMDQIEPSESYTGGWGVPFWRMGHFMHSQSKLFIIKISMLLLFDFRSHEILSSHFTRLVAPSCGDTIFSWKDGWSFTKYFSFFSVCGSAGCLFFISFFSSCIPVVCRSYFFCRLSFSLVGCPTLQW